jgi:response regulator of citrate/malate metabolism
VGISRITARRYLEHLVESGRAARAPQYGQVGRPELRYRWSGH